MKKAHSKFPFSWFFLLSAIWHSIL